jgi:hypothetical protein
MKMVWRCGGDEDGVDGCGEEEDGFVFAFAFVQLLRLFCGPVFRPQKGANKLQKQNGAGPKLIHFIKNSKGAWLFGAQ